MRAAYSGGLTWRQASALSAEAAQPARPTTSRLTIAEQYVRFVRITRDQFGYRQMFLHHVIEETRFSRPILNASCAAID
jgi:hypothetical protein